MARRKRILGQTLLRQPRQSQARLRSPGAWLWRVAIVLSVAVHVGPSLLPPALAWLEELFTVPPGTFATAEPLPAASASVAAASGRTPEAIQAERAALVKSALAARDAGELKLGSFLLAADRLDAEQAGVELDHAAAERALAERCAQLERELGKADVVHAVSASFGELPYSIAVRRLTGMLLEEAGACGPTAQLTAACLYDLGRREGLALRYWGGVNAQGTNHITATWRERGVTWDLASYAPVKGSGVSFPADQLVEAYARAHGLLEPLPGQADAAEPEVDVAAATSFRYPPNRDIFSTGEDPLFAERPTDVSENERDGSAGETDAAAGTASGGRGGPSRVTRWVSVYPSYLTDEWMERGHAYRVPADSQQSPASPDRDPPPCPVRPGLFFVQRVAVAAPSGPAQVELLPTPSRRGLTYLSAVVAQYSEYARRDSEHQRLLADACLAIAYGWAAPRYSAAGFPRIALEASSRAQRHARRADERLAELAASPSFAAQIAADSTHWLLVATPAGRSLLLELERDSGPTRPVKNDPLRTDALLGDLGDADALFELSHGFDFEKRYYLTTRLRELSLFDTPVELPAAGWLPEAMAALDHSFQVMGERGIGSEEYLQAHLAYLRTLGAKPEELSNVEQGIRKLWRRLPAPDAADAGLERDDATLELLELE